MSQGKPSLVQRILGWIGFGDSQPTNKTTSSKKTASSSPRSNQGERERTKLPVTTPKLFIGNLSYSVDEEQLQELFESAGSVQKAEIVKHRNTERSKGFAFVTMETIADAEAAAEQLDGKQVDGRAIGVSGAKAENRKPSSTKRSPSKKASTKNSVENREQRGSDNRGPRREQRDSDNRSNNRGPRGRGGRGRGQGKSRAAESTVVPMAVPEVMSSKLIIKNIDESFSDSELEALFDGVASISESKIESGTVSVEMKSVDAAQEAVRVLDGKDFMGKTLSVTEA